MIYAAIGLVLLALTIAVARETIIETFEANYRSRRDKLAEKARVRKEAIRRRQLEARERRRRALEEVQQAQAQAQAQGTEAAVEVVGVAPGGGRGGRGALAAGRTRTKDDNAALDMSARTLTFSAPTLPDDPDHLPRESLLHRLQRIVSRPFHKAASEVDFRRSLKDFKSGRTRSRRSSISSVSSAVTTSSLDESFRSLKEQLVREQREEFRGKLAISSGLFLVFWLGGSAVFMVTERWTFGVALYFSCTYFLTLG